MGSYQHVDFTEFHPVNQTYSLWKLDTAERTCIAALFQVFLEIPTCSLYVHNFIVYGEIFIVYGKILKNGLLPN